mmetsp:Transcript_19667/g.45695  ORF Transcript_19667/g.45695 Transcript_19667/m.45695 type:complete len:210 (+) Transcript_19667:1247-1876(+)
MYCAQPLCNSSACTSCSGRFMTCHRLTKLDRTPKVSPARASSEDSVSTSGKTVASPWVEGSEGLKPRPVSAFKVDVFPALACPTNMSFSVRGRTFPQRKASRKACLACSSVGAHWFLRELLIVGDASSVLRCRRRCSATVRACRFCLKVSLSAWACFSAIDICFFPITAAVLEKGIIDSDGDVTLPDPGLPGPPLAYAAGLSCADGSLE